MTSRTFQKIRLGIVIFSIILFPVTFYYLSPIISIKGSIAGIISGSVLNFLVLLVAGMFLGRSFCSWLCPAGGIQDQAMVSRTKTVPVRKISWLKYLVWGSWLGMLLLFFRRAGGISGVEYAYSTKMGLSATSAPALISYSIVVLVFLLFGLIFGRRTGCHTLCWIAPFMVIGRKLGLALKIPSLRLAADYSNCVSCGRCTAACPMSLPVKDLARRQTITDNNCILCGKCLDTCKRDVINWAWH